MYYVSLKSMLILSACLDASEIIPETGKKSNKIPGWDVKLSHEIEIALSWRVFGLV